MRLLTTSLVWLVLCGACERTSPPPAVAPGRAFYAWRTEFALSTAESHALTEHRITRLYLRLFDLGWDSTGEHPTVLGQVHVQPNAVPAHLELVPVVYLENEVLRGRTESADDMASRLLDAVALAQPSGTSWHELQVDCDWTPSTRDRFFALAAALRALLHQRHQILSVTIRLHQVKYRERTGVPPADRGMLMAYNLGDVRRARAEPYIYEPSLAARYLARLAEYPLELDLALPAFGQVTVFRKDQLLTLLPLSAANELGSPPSAGQARRARTLDADVSWKGVELHRGDELVVERVTDEVLRGATRQFGGARKWGNIALFSLDASALAGLDPRTLEESLNPPAQE